MQMNGTPMTRTLVPEWLQPGEPAKRAHVAVVERDKIVDYLLNSAHPDNGGKARFFESLGFSVGAAALLIDALRGVAETGEVVEVVDSSHGEKYVVDGSLSSQTESS